MLTALFHPSRHQPSQRGGSSGATIILIILLFRIDSSASHCMLCSPLGHLSKNYISRLTLYVVFLISRKLKGKHHEIGSRSPNFPRPVYYTHGERRFGSIALQSNYFVVTQTKNTTKKIKVCHESDACPNYYDDDVPKAKGRIDLRVRFLKCHDLIKQHASMGSNNDRTVFMRIDLRI